MFPSQGGGQGVPLDTLGMIKAFAGNFEPGGYVACNGQLLSIAQNQALFAVLGTTYGGDGVTTFALPDLRGRDIIGAGPGTPIGAKVGQTNVNLVNGQAPTPLGGPVTPFDNRQPSLAMQYIISLQGIFPTQGGGQDPVDAVSRSDRQLCRNLRSERLGSLRRQHPGDLAEHGVVRGAGDVLWRQRNHPTSRCPTSATESSSVPAAESRWER